MKHYLFTILIITFSNATIAKDISITSFYGKYRPEAKQPGAIAKSLNQPVKETWQSPKIKQAYTVGILLPHVKDNYWKTINKSLIEHAKKIGVNIKIYSAEGYANAGTQRKQMTHELIKKKIDGIIISSVTYDKLDRFIATATKNKIPTVALVNDVLAPNITGKVQINFDDIGSSIADYIIEDSKGIDIRVALFLGPEKAYWAKQTYNSFIERIKNNPNGISIGKVTIVANQYGTTLAKHQTNLLDAVLKAKDNIHYIIANGTAAQVAPTILAKYSKQHPNAKIVASYVTNEHYNLIKDQLIAVGFSDAAFNQATIALDLVIKHIQNKQQSKQVNSLPFRIAPKLIRLSRDNLKDYPMETLFAPADFKPIFEFMLSPYYKFE